MRKNLAALVSSLFMATSSCAKRDIIPVETAPVYEAESSIKEHVPLYSRDANYRYVINAEYTPDVGFIPTSLATVVDYL